jgi:hypothetical protein
MARTSLDYFRTVYTINIPKEKYAKEDLVENICAKNAMKILTWIPVISQIISTIFLISTLCNKKYNPSLKIAFISRFVIGIIASPLLMLIDLIGTAIKSIIDARNARAKKATNIV